MKKSYLCIITALLCALQLHAQHALKSHLNMMRPGDKIIKQQVSYKDPGRTGENVLWDFSKLNTENEEYKLVYSPLGGDSIVVGTEHNTMYYYSLSNDSLLLWGFENTTTLMTDAQPEVLMKFPVRYGDYTQSHYHGTGKYCERLSLDAMGTVETWADAYGTMVMPDKDTLKHVIRTRTFKRIAEETKSITHPSRVKKPVPFLSSDTINHRLLTDSVVMEVETYRWFEEGYRYPIFETVSSKVIKNGEAQDFFNVSFFYPPQEHSYLEEDVENLAILDSLSQIKNKEDILSADPWKGLTYNFYPNPVITNLDVEMFLPHSASKVRMQLCNRQGQTLLEESWGSLPEGIFSKQVFMSPYVHGEYIINIWLDDHLVSGKILKR